jgi:hypothetical protein
MAETLADKVIQGAVSRVQVRAERQEDVGQLVETFVDPGISVQLENNNNQILYGRRGTGKTHVLKVVERSAESEEASFAIFIDMRTLGSSSIFSDGGRPIHVRVANLLKDVLSLIDNALLEWATEPERDLPGSVLEALDALSSAISASVIVDPTVTVAEAATKESKSGGSGSLTIGAVPSITLGGEGGTTQGESETTTRSGREINPVYFQDLAQAARGVVAAGGLGRLLILLDEWTAVPLDLQPLLAEFLKRTFFTIPQVTIKIASLEYRSNFSESLEQNNVLGFELGADIASTIELDDYFVYDRNTERTVELFAELLYRHLSAEADAIADVRRDGQEQIDFQQGYLAETYAIASPAALVRRFFASPEAFQELVRAGEGVARDFLNIFSSGFFSSVRRGRPSIDVRAVQEAAREWYEKDKAPNVDDDQARVLRTIVDKVIAERRARSFLLENQYEKDPLILSLFDFRLLHLVQRGYADKDRPGVRYNIYTLDYGTYVDLIGTQKAPTGDFTEELAGEGETVVPFDDKRSIRRIILRPEQLRGDESERAD